MSGLKRVTLSCAAAFVCLVPGMIRGSGVKTGREDGEFRIYASGKEIGTEKYVIVSSQGAVSSTSFLDFRNPADRHQKIQLETKLEMDGGYLPKSYQLKSNVDGQKGMIQGVFSQGQAMFEYVAGEVPRKEGLLVGDHYTILDTNIFHHFVFLVRLFKYGAKEKEQRFEVVIPQEQQNGLLRISEQGSESIAVHGRKIRAHRLCVDSGSVKIYLWVDENRILRKLTVPGREIEVLRNP